MVAGCDAADGDAGHGAPLAAFRNRFGDVMTTDHVIGRPRIGTAAGAAA